MNVARARRSDWPLTDGRICPHNSLSRAAHWETSAFTIGS